MNPVLPEELILGILVRLPDKSRHTASLVCHRRLHLLESSEFYILREEFGHVNHLACFLQPNPPSNIASNQHHPSHVITVFDPVSHNVKILPPIPKSTSIIFDNHSEIVSTEGKLILMNPCDPNNPSLGNSIFVFDFSTGLWRRGKDFPARSSRFAIAAAPDYRVFVGGGFNPNPDNLSPPPCSAWMYDVRKDEWSKLPPMDHLQVQGVSRGQVYGNKFRFITVSPMCSVPSIEIYDFESGEWEYWDYYFAVPDNPYEFYFRLDLNRISSTCRLCSREQTCSRQDSGTCFRVYKLLLGVRMVFIFYEGGNSNNIFSFFIRDQDLQMIEIPVPHLIYGNLSSGCCVEVH